MRAGWRAGRRAGRARGESRLGAAAHHGEVGGGGGEQAAPLGQNVPGFRVDLRRTPRAGSGWQDQDQAVILRLFGSGLGG